MGFDVDYDFLKRLSNENRGIAQRIYGNQDTSSQLKVTFFFCSFFIIHWKSFNYPYLMHVWCITELNSEWSWSQPYLVGRIRKVLSSFLTRFPSPSYFCSNSEVWGRWVMGTAFLPPEQKGLLSIIKAPCSSPAPLAIGLLIIMANHFLFNTHWHLGINFSQCKFSSVLR